MKGFPYLPPRDYFGARPGRVEGLRAACESWRGTPFRACSCVKGEGGGVDCAGFLGAVFRECGAVAQLVAVPPYAVNHAEHSDESLFRAWFERAEVRARVRRVDEAEPHLDGDIVFPRVGRTEHHAGVRIANLVFHIARPSGWCCMTTAQLKFHPSRYRLLEAVACESASFTR